MSDEWKVRAAAKKALTESCIPPKWLVPADQLPGKHVRDVTAFPRESGLLSARELEITETDLIPLARKLQTGEWRAREVTEAFCHRAAIAHQLVNCLVEVFFDVALAQAEAADEHFRTNGKPIGPLHGVPVSLKDQFRVTGVETTMGYVRWIGKKDTMDSVLVDLLRRAGAILYVKTNVPQTLMLGETRNNIFGETRNPFNRALSCGGSSGGEGALLAMRGAVVGVGTDIGGSIRIPAAFCSLYGLRPSHGRLPYALAANSMDGQETIHSVCGPLGHTPEDLGYFVKAVLAQQPWYHDPKVIEMPWRSDKMLEGIVGVKTFAVIDSDGECTPHPPVQRALREVRGALERAGHRVVPWPNYRVKEMVQLVLAIFSADGGLDLRSAVEGEEPVAGIESIIRDRQSLTLNGAWDLQKRKREFERLFMEHWNAVNRQHGVVDGLIMPVAPHAAVEPHKYLYYGYTYLANLLDYPSVVVRVGKADPQQDKRIVDFSPVNELDGRIQETYDPEMYAGAPTAVQVVGRRLQEEYTLGLAQQIRFALQGTSAAETAAQLRHSRRPSQF
ncbi:Acetamidase [Savitreella phatthalungensis]